MSPGSNWRKKLRPELELILCCGRTRLDEATAGRVRSLLHGELNWSDVVAISFRQRRNPPQILSRLLTRIDPEIVRFFVSGPFDTQTPN
jgi:hypothetical protein